MSSKTTFVGNSEGLHLRVAAEIVNVSKRHKSKVSLHCQGNCQDCRQADSCSILQLLMLEATKGKPVIITANGPDEHEVIEKIHQILEDNKGAQFIQKTSICKRR